ncbi:MAG: hypothetical protein AMXMBFR47_33340 [Planctomycetota bacterium]
MFRQWLISLAAALSASIAAGQPPTCSGGPDEGLRPQASGPTSHAGERDDGRAALDGGCGEFGDLDDLAALPLPREAQRSISDRLAAWDAAEQANAVILPRLAADADPRARAAADHAAELWNSGDATSALVELRALESAGVLAVVSINWRVARDGGPQPRWGGTDREIPSSGDAKQTVLDFDRITGRLFCVHSCYSNEWWIDWSLDGGATWHNTAGVVAGAPALDIDAAIVGELIYVGVVWANRTDVVGVERLFTATGWFDHDYGYLALADSSPATIEEVALASNADSFQSRIYVATLQNDGSVRFFWDVSTDGKSFTEASPTGVNAASGLDLTWNPDYASRFLFMSYLGADERVHVLRSASSLPTWDDVVVRTTFTGTKPITALSAYEDTVICAFSELYADGVGVQYRISYDAGDTWNLGDIFRPTAGEGTYSMFDMTARGGAGTAAAAQREIGEPDLVLFNRRGGYAPGLWEGEGPFNDHDVTTGTWLSLSWLPPRTTTPRSYSYGAVYLSGAGTAYFDRFNHCGGDLNGSGAIDLQDLAQLLAHYGTTSAAYADGDIDGDASVSLTDLALLLSVFGVTCP